MNPTSAIDATESVDESPWEQALSRLKDRYGEARGLVSSELPYANLDWILGGKADSSERPTTLDLKMIPLLSLWLQDLAAEVERARSPEPAGEMDEREALAHEAREAMAVRLREATQGFVAALHRPA